MTTSSNADSEIDPVRPPPSSHASVLLIGSGLFATALAVRLIPWRSVFQSDGAVPFGGDAYYHMVRIRDAVERFPSILRFDPMMNFPDGAQPIWPPTFDWILAALLRATVGPGAPDTLERAIMWVAPLLGAATVVVVYLLGRRFFPPGTGALAALLLALLPAHFNYSQLGFTDHHVAVSLIATVVLWCGMRLFAEAPVTPPDGRGLSRAAILGLATGALLLVWPGALIHVVILEAALLGRLFSTRDVRHAICWAYRFALLHVVALIVVGPLSIGQEWLRWGRFSPVVLSDFQPLYLGSAALAFLLCAQIWARLPAAERAVPRATIASAIGIVLASTLLVLIPELRIGAFDSWTWLSRNELFQDAVNESVPLFRSGAHFDVDRPLMLFGFSIFLVPIALLGLVRPRAGRVDHLFFLWWTASFFVATLGQRRFMDTYAVPHALLISWFGVSCFDWALARLGGSVATRRWLGGVSAMLVLALFWPIHARYERDVRDLVLVARGEAPPLRGLARQIRPIRESALWLRDHSPEPTGPGYSVLGPWDVGHLIQYVAERPVVQNNFGDDIAEENFARAERYFSATDESEAIEIVAPARVRYVLARANGSGHPIFPYGPSSMTSRLFLMRGSRGRIESYVPDHPIQVEALERHRLVFESAPLTTRATRDHPTTYVKLFEIVNGARVVGRAPAGAQIRFVLDLQSRYGGSFGYEATTVADAAGRFQVRLPYSNETFSPDVRTAPVWRVIYGGETASLRVPEVAVQQGLDVEGPQFE